MSIFKHITALILLCIFASPALAQEAQHEDVEIKVNGMVCDFCAQSVWKVFEDYEAVDTVDVDLDTGTVKVHLKADQSLSDENLNKAITYAGYDLVSIERMIVSH